jgi:hypothetical protein
MTCTVSCSIGALQVAWCSPRIRGVAQTLCDLRSTAAVDLTRCYTDSRVQLLELPLRDSPPDPQRALPKPCITRHEACLEECKRLDADLPIIPEVVQPVWVQLDECESL